MTVVSFTALTEPGVQAGRIDIFPLRHWVAILALAAGCSAPPPPSGIPAGPVTPPPAAAVPVAPAPARWRVNAADTPASFVVESRAVVSARADSLARTDTLAVRTTVTATPRGAAIDVTITAYAVRPTAGAERALGTAVRAIARFDAAGGVAFEGAGLANCALMSGAAFESTRDLWVRWPTNSLAVGDKWRDSTRSSVCRDGVPMQVTLIREYTLTGASGDERALLLTVARRSTIAIRGSGVIRGDTTIVSGDGTATATLRVTALTGWIQDAEGESRLTLTARGKSRTQAVEQTVRLAVRREGASR